MSEPLAKLAYQVLLVSTGYIGFQVTGMGYTPLLNIMKASSTNPGARNSLRSENVLTSTIEYSELALLSFIDNMQN